MQNISVAVHIKEQVLTGLISLLPNRRLSDFLNGDCVKQSDVSCTFSKLTDVTISHVDGKNERAETVYINWEAIQMVRTLESDSARGIGANDGPKQYPFVHKLPVRATMYMPGYEVHGYLHRANGQDVPQLLTQELAFLPCTDATICGNDEGSNWYADFVAINKRQICSLRHDE